MRRSGERRPPDPALRRLRHHLRLQQPGGRRSSLPRPSRMSQRKNRCSGRGMAQLALSCLRRARPRCSTMMRYWAKVMASPHLKDSTEYPSRASLPVEECFLPVAAWLPPFVAIAASELPQHAAGVAARCAFAGTSSSSPPCSSSWDLVKLGISCTALLPPRQPPRIVHSPHTSGCNDARDHNCSCHAIHIAGARSPFLEVHRRGMIGGIGALWCGLPRNFVSPRDLETPVCDLETHGCDLETRDCEPPTVNRES